MYFPDSTVLDADLRNCAAKKIEKLFLGKKRLTWTPNADRKVGLTMERRQRRSPPTELWRTIVLYSLSIIAFLMSNFPIFIENTIFHVKYRVFQILNIIIFLPHLWKKIILYYTFLINLDFSDLIVKMHFYQSNQFMIFSKWVVSMSESLYFNSYLFTDKIIYC